IIAVHPEASPGDGSPSDAGPDSGPSDGGPTSEAGDAGCPAPTTLACNGTCVDPTLPSNCKTCGNVCSGPETGSGGATCTNGSCTVGCDADGSTPLNCSGACVDPTQPAHCGGCSLNCGGPASGQGTPTCVLDGGGGLPLDAGGDGGPCGFTCTSGFHLCNVDCVSDSDDPSTDPCEVNVPGTGIFVAPPPLGSPSGNGTMAAPLSTVTAGIAKAVTGVKRVYVCEGTYSEQLSLTGADDGVAVYGNLDCNSGWVYASSASTVVATPAGAAAPGTALTVTGPMTTGVVFEDVSFTAIDGKAAGDSSVAVFASNAKLTLTRGTVTAGMGILGSGGGTGSNWSGTAQGGNPNGQIPTAVAGGPGGANACSDGTSSAGGTGGSFDAGNGSWGSGLPGSSNPSVGTGNAGVGAAGGVGAGGNAPTQVGAGATSSGSVTSAGWSVGSPGGPGHNGNPGQGGGGGGSAPSTGGGGGGGSGGCGGGSGTGGSGGGSSYGILAFQSAVSAVNVTLVAVAAGGGGSGGPGQNGQGGGAAGPGFSSGNYAGGKGGPGSAGSGGGGGAGGNSAGIAWLGTTGPSVNGQVISANQATYSGITVGTAGAAGPGGTGSGPSGNPGSTGSALAILQFP
ncbi:MAG: hypothetical protein ACRELB_16100, partial [Polyangiaceae bacterium]